MKKQLLIVLVFGALLQGCETVVEIQIPNEPEKLVINSTLNPNAFIKVHLSASRHILDDYKIIGLEGATLDVYEDDVLLTTLPDSLNGFYISPTYKPKRGKTYKIRASASGYEPASGEVLLPLDTVRVLSLQIDTVQQNNYGYLSQYLRLGIEVKDAAEIENFYSISAIEEYYWYEFDLSVNPPVKIDSVLFSNKTYLQSADPELENNQNYGQNILMTDELFNGKTTTINVQMPFNYYDGIGNIYQSAPNYYLVIRNISKSYYLYERSVALQQSIDGNPFAQPVQVYNNIENGFGIVGAYNSVLYPIQ